jgi:hypothetical protein
MADKRLLGPVTAPTQVVGRAGTQHAFVQHVGTAAIGEGR